MIFVTLWNRNCEWFCLVWQNELKNLFIFFTVVISKIANWKKWKASFQFSLESSISFENNISMWTDWVVWFLGSLTAHEQFSCAFICSFLSIFCQMVRVYKALFRLLTTHFHIKLWPHQEKCLILAPRVKLLILITEQSPFCVFAIL